MREAAAKRETDPRREQAIETTVWFSILAHARQTEDFAEAAKALRELEHLGVKVKFRPTGQAVSA